MLVINGRSGKHIVHVHVCDFGLWKNFRGAKILKISQK